MVRLILLTDFTEGFAHYLLKGILTYSKEREPWVVCRMPPSYKRQYGIPGVIEWAKKWNADAIIAQFADDDPVELFAENGIIAVAQDFKSRFKTIHNITGDYFLTGSMAAEFFIRKGFRNFAFYGYKDVVWSAERCQGFRNEITRYGYGDNFSEYQFQELEDLWFYETEPLFQWLLSLPKPVALMACDDNQGNRITEACRICNIRIPEEISVLGVDNDELTCNLSEPTLSSVGMDIERAGYEAAGLIEKLIRMPGPPRRDVVIKPTRIISRESTDIYATVDPHILSALKYIHQNVTHKINVTNVLKHVPLSRRLLEIRFKEATGLTVYRYIFELRMELLTRKLLESDMPVSELACEVGLPDARNVSRQFKQLKGCSPQEYRKRHNK